MHAWDYYYVARVLDQYYPEQSDSILLYLAKAAGMIERERMTGVGRRDINQIKELQLIMAVPHAKAFANKGMWKEAYNIMTKEALPLLNDLTGKRNIFDQKHAIYQFLANYYEKFNNPKQALKYQKLLRDSDAERYEKEKVQAINDMSVKYETEKKELQLFALAEKIKTNRRTFIGLTIGLFIIFALIIRSGRLKRKNVEQKLYETALLAELHQNELENLKNSNRQADKQQVGEYRVQNTVESIAHLVAGALIESDTKKQYLDRLSKLEPKLLESIYQNADVKLTGMDMKYIICFAADLDTKDISLIFNVEPASVNTVRYRIRKKCAKDDNIRAIL
jgi:hypothetical protein